MEADQGSLLRQSILALGNAMKTWEAIHHILCEILRPAISLKDDVTDTSAIEKDSDLGGLVTHTTELHQISFPLSIQLVANEAELNVLDVAFGQVDLDSSEMVVLEFILGQSVSLDLIEDHAWLEVRHQLW